MENRNRFTKLVLGALIIFIIFLVVFFFWGELAGLSTSKKISHEKFNAFFTSLGAIFTATSIFFLYKQNKMLQEERKLSVQPDLFLKSIEVITEDYELKNSRGNYAPLFKFGENHNLIPNVPVELHNIGLGSAKDISVMWFYDVDEVKKIVEEAYTVHLSHYEIIQFNNIDFLKVNDSIKITIPYGYMALLGNRIEKPIDIYDGSNTTQEIPKAEKPKLEVIIIYSNNYNQREQKKFLLKVEKDFNKIRINFLLVTI